MAVFKCKMCGGDLEILEDSSVCECEYCGTKQTVPKMDDEKKLKLFSRAGRLLRDCEFDKAAVVYEAIVTDFDQEAEAYWGLILCKYGVEYVDDPASGKKIPTCHRSSFDSVMEDNNFELVMENADSIARPVYRAEAKEIERIRKGVMEISAKEEPYDVFICYKETGENGDRTVDSLIAQDVYTALTEKGYRVFFSRISLEDKLGQEYEPYIFAALHSARVMLAFGTSYDNYNAVWVKNEWSRYLALIAKGEKKTLIPCYKDLDAYDMPKEFHRFQAQDMGKVGALQDLVRGVEKIIDKKKAETTPSVQQPVVSGGPNVAALLKRGQLALEDEKWDAARLFFDQVLSMDAENAQAYLGLAMAEAKCIDRDMFASAYTKANSPHRDSNNIKYAKAFSPSLKAWVSELDAKAALADEEDWRALERVKQRLEPARKQNAIASKMIAVGWFHTVGLNADGTVVATGLNDSGQRKVSGWTDVIAVAAGDYHTVGLKADGTVLATKYIGEQKNYFGQCDVSGWNNIVAIAAGKHHTVGLKKDGTVVAVGSNKLSQCKVSDWRDIVAITADDWETLGLKANGTMVSTGLYKHEVSRWTEIATIASHGSAGIHWNGKVIKLGAEVSHWEDIVDVAISLNTIVGLKADGTVVAEGNNFGQCNVSDWRDIVAVAAGASHTIGLKKDGTLVAVGADSYNQCRVSSWKLFNSLDTIEAERKVGREKIIAAQEKAEAERKAMEAKRRATQEKEEAERNALKEMYAALAAENEQNHPDAHTENRRGYVSEKEERERRYAEAMAENERRYTLTMEKSSLQAELANLRGLFTGKRRKEIEARLSEIEIELKRQG